MWPLRQGLLVIHIESAVSAIAPLRSAGPAQSCSLFDLPAAKYDSAALELLASAMAAATLPASRTPSGYVYLGQFIAHDLSRLDPTQGAVSRIDELRQLRTPVLNLENIYGKGFDDPDIALNKRTGYMEIGHTLDASGAAATLDDLPRGAACLARIPDDRDDENLIVAQLHVAFLKLHNFFCDRLRLQGVMDPQALFYAARRELILHYQEVVLYDFLPAIVDASTWRSVVLERRLQLWQTSRSEPARMPIEFATAAFRFGHSMVRQHYTLNARLPLVDLQTLFSFTGHGAMGGGTQGALPQSHVIDWRLFFPFEADRERRFMNFGMRIDPAVSIKAPPDFTSLVAKSLRTGVRCLLPSAQSVVTYLEKHHVNLGIGLLTSDELSPEVHVIEGSTVRTAKLLELADNASGFATDTPLVYYVLAEAHARCDGLRLGPLASRIVAEVLCGAVFTCTPSIMFEQRDKRFVHATGETLGSRHLRMSDLLRAAA